MLYKFPVLGDTSIRCGHAKADAATYLVGLNEQRLHRYPDSFSELHGTLDIGVW